jgi:geranylgeranyl pyrophosphate synthase
MAQALADTVLARLAGDLPRVLGAGKLLRARLALRLAVAGQGPATPAVPAAAAVELIHAASLLHDDVIDGGLLRRNCPAFWQERGIPGAILAGDLLLMRALGLLAALPDPRLLRELIQFTGEICNAESEQELVSRGGPADWPACLDIDRRKTGALFAFAAGAAGGEEPRRRAALQEAGYAIGTAYQLADDLLDATGDEHTAGKTLGRDRARLKNTAATTFPGDPAGLLRQIADLRQRALTGVRDWPEARAALHDYFTLDFDPALQPLLGHPASVQQEAP